MRIDPVDGLPARVHIEESSTSSDTRYKIYEERAACGDSILDGARDLDVDASKNDFIGFANTSFTSTRVFELLGKEAK